jgi:hypothetical protein
MDLGKIKVRKFIGVSAGAFLSVFLFSNLNPQIIRNLNDFAIKNNSKYAIDHIMLKACWELLPENIHELINGKISILVSKGAMSKKREKYIDNYESKLHVMQVLHASSYIPFITSKKYDGVNIKGEKYFDGAFSNYNPKNFFNDIPQLVFYTSKVNYSLSNMLNFNDPLPEIIILRGLLEFEKFILNLMKDKVHKNNNFPIKWIEPYTIYTPYATNRNKESKNNTVNVYKERGSEIISTKIKSTKLYLQNPNQYGFFKNLEIKDNLHSMVFVLFLTMCEIMAKVSKK